MQFHLQQAFRAVILFAFFGFLLKLHLKEEITMYINPKYDLLSQIAAVLFLFLFFIQIQRIWVKKLHDHDEHCHHGCGHDHGYKSPPLKRVVSYLVLIFPLLTGFFLPPKTLDASIAAKKGTMLTRPSQPQSKSEAEKELYLDGNNQEADDDENQESTNQEVLPNPNEMSEEEYKDKMNQLGRSDFIDMRDDVFEPYYEMISMDPKRYLGKEVKLSGFVYKEEGFQQNQLVISRFLITHCIADASIIGFLTELGNADSIEQDTWLQIKGEIQLTHYNGYEIPMIKASSWEFIDKPDEPYVYPVLTKLE